MQQAINCYTQKALSTEMNIFIKHTPFFIKHTPRVTAIKAPRRLLNILKVILFFYE